MDKLRRFDPIFVSVYALLVQVEIAIDIDSSDRKPSSAAIITNIEKK